MWLIIGSWFQKNDVMESSERPGMGAVVVMCEAMNRKMFHGVLTPEPQLRRDASEGWVHDGSGKAVLFDVRVDTEQISFKKVYERALEGQGGSGQEIRYTFTRKEGEIWVGNYVGQKVGSGLTWAAIVPIDPRLFNDKYFSTLMGCAFAHEWPASTES